MIQAYGVKIDGVGQQGHLVIEKTPTQDTPTPSVETLVKSLNLYADLGVDVAYTEVDIRMLTPATAAKLQTQADHYGRVASACMNVTRCVGITVWVCRLPSAERQRPFPSMPSLTNISLQGVSDKYSWVPNTFSGEGSALLWDNNYQKKPAYAATIKAIQA
jgi:endo-1,4-beta-xylanase